MTSAGCRSLSGFLIAALAALLLFTPLSPSGCGDADVLRPSTVRVVVNEIEATTATFTLMPDTYTGTVEIWVDTQINIRYGATDSSGNTQTITQTLELADIPGATAGQRGSDEVDFVVSPNTHSVVYFTVELTIAPGTVDMDVTVTVGSAPTGPYIGSLLVTPNFAEGGDEAWVTVYFVRDSAGSYLTLSVDVRLIDGDIAIPVSQLSLSEDTISGPQTWGGRTVEVWRSGFFSVPPRDASDPPIQVIARAEDANGSITPYVAAPFSIYASGQRDAALLNATNDTFTVTLTPLVSGDTQIDVSLSYDGVAPTGNWKLVCWEVADPTNGLFVADASTDTYTDTLTGAVETAFCQSIGLDSSSVVHDNMGYFTMP